MSRAIQIQGLRYQYPDGTPALNGIDFHLDTGESVALFGANGSGKTTFVLHLNGLLRGEGTIEICGLPLADATLEQIRSKVGVVFQDSDEQLFMPTVLEDVAFGPLNLGLSPDDALTRARTVLQRVGMAHALERAPYHLSAGEKKRVAIAGVLAMDPEILVLDEPTTFLDPPTRRDLLTLLQGLPQSKVVVTHDANLARALTTRAVFFDQGQIAGEGEVIEIVQRFHWEYL